MQERFQRAVVRCKVLAQPSPHGAVQGCARPRIVAVEGGRQRDREVQELQQPAYSSAGSVKNTLALDDVHAARSRAAW